MEIIFKPLADRILVEPLPAEEITAGGIILPTNAELDLPLKGVVVKVGPGKKDQKMTIVEGDTVIYKKRSGVKVLLGTKEYLIMNEGDTYAIL